MIYNNARAPYFKIKTFRSGFLDEVNLKNQASLKKNYSLFTGKQLLWLILPIVVEQIFSTSLGLFDSMMVSGIDTTGNAGNAVSNVDYINNLVIQLFSAFTTGGAIVTSQLIGAKELNEAKRSAKQMVMLVLSASLFIGGLCLLLNYQILKLFYGGVSAETFACQQTYFYITAASFPFIGLFNACASLLRVQRRSIVTMVSAGMSCALNIILNALFIFVFKLGVTGAALATAISRALPAVMMMIMLADKRNEVYVRYFEKFRFDVPMLKKILKLAIPSGIESCLFQLGKLMTSSFVNVSYYVSAETGMNIEANGNSIANSVNNIASVVGSGVGTSCLTVVGQAAGTGDIDQCRYYMKKMFVISAIANAAFVSLILALAPQIVNLYGYSAEAKQIALKCLYFCLAFQFVTYPPAFTSSQILKATSDVKYVMASAISSMILIRVGLCFLMTTDLIEGLPKLGAFGYWIGMCSDWVVRSVLFILRLISGKWKKSSGLFVLSREKNIKTDL